MNEALEQFDGLISAQLASSLLLLCTSHPVVGDGCQKLGFLLERLLTHLHTSGSQCLPTLKDAKRDEGKGLVRSKVPVMILKSPLNVLSEI